MNKYWKYIALALGVIVLDQVTKLLVFENMQRGEEIKLIGNWLKLHYTLNPGMAFGIELPPPYGKILLSVFRLLAVVAIGFYLKNIIEKKMHPGLALCVSLILAGALGNVIDSTFYGVFLGEKNLIPGAPTPWFYGQVIDMIYFDIWAGILPEWIPIWGGEYAAFWPIFNVADSSIFVGVTTILIMQKKFFVKEEATSNSSEQQEQPSINTNNS